MKRITAQISGAQGASQLIIPVFLLVLSVMGGMGMIAHQAARRQYAEELMREKIQLIQSLNFEAESFMSSLTRDDGLAELLNPQRAQEIGSRVLGALNQRQAGDYSALIHRSEASVIAEAGDPDTINLRRAYTMNLVQAAQMRGVETTIVSLGREARLVQDGMGLLSVVTLPLGRNIVLISTRPLSTSGIKRLSTMLALPELRVIPGESIEETSYAVSSLDGKTRMSIVWTPSREAMETFADLAMQGLVGCVLVAFIAIFLFHRMRKTTEALLKREAQATHEARHDALSGLPNRAVFCEIVTQQLEELEKNGRKMAILLLDLDKFKDVNDTYGHAAGDQMIIEFGQRVRSLLRHTDIIARLGGDEFAVMLTSINTHHEANQLAQAIVEVANKPFMLEGASVRVGVSIGGAFAPDNGNELAVVLRAADTALYRAKGEGRNRFSFYEYRMTEAERIRKLVDDELRSAIEREEFTLLYQPQVFADTGRIASVEALVRWHHPIHGVISPATFIPVAEERGLIVPLGEWVMKRACRDASRWPGLRVGVNVSAIQFRQKSFVESVERVLAESHIEPARLELELTEGVLVEHADQAEDAMIDLRSLGVKLALDDFGTGYSSLIYLRRFAFDKIKIDKSFLDSMEDTGESAILVHSVVHLGRALGLEVTAEGVETQEQRRFLQSVGCHYLQGYLFSKPITAEAIDQMLLAERAADAASLIQQRDVA